MMVNPHNRVRLNVRGLAELACLGISITASTLLGWWSWHDAVLFTNVANAPGWLEALRRPEVLVSVALAEFTLIMAALLAVVPSEWWLYTLTMTATSDSVTPQPPETLLRWLGAQVQKAVNPAPPAPEAPGTQAVGASGATYGEQLASALPGMLPPIPGQMQAQPGQPAPVQAFTGQPVPEQAPAQPPSPPQALGQPMAPGATQPNPAHPTTEGQPANTAAAPAAPLSEVLKFEEFPPEDDPLADLADIKDILSSAFDEDAGTDPDREALGRSLDEIGIQVLLNLAHQVQDTFALGETESQREFARIG